MAWSEVGDTACPIARALAVVGDRWTLLILRELFLGVKRFEEFQTQTGMSSHLLSSRLKRLEGDGLDLYPLLLSLKAWGEQWGGFGPKAEPALVITHRQCGHTTGLKLVCPSCDEPFGPRDASAALGSTFKAERQARRDGTPVPARISPKQR